MSHTPPTPLTSTSPVLDKTPEPRVPLIHALTATTPHPDPTPALPSPSHPHTLTAHTHAPQTTVHASQLLLLYALFNHPRLLIQVARVQKAQFSYRLDGLVP